MMGVNTHRITAISWGVAGGLGALACILLIGGPTNLENPYIMTEFQVNSFLAGILGGFSTFGGPIFAACIIPILKEVLGFFNGTEMSYVAEYASAIVYFLALIVILIKPNGLFGKKIAKKV